MENQHRRISGYRELTEEEIALMNEIKALGPVIEAVCLKVKAHVAAQRSACDFNGDTGYDPTGAIQAAKAEHDRLNQAEPEKWAGWGSDGMQSSLMYLTRAVAQPTFF